MIRFPHCDARVVHAPGACAYCDASGLQAVREAWGIAFTGAAPEPGKAPCPAEQARPLATIERWPGNRPVAPAACGDCDGTGWVEGAPAGALGATCATCGGTGATAAP